MYVVLGEELSKYVRNFKFIAFDFRTNVPMNKT